MPAVGNVITGNGTVPPGGTTNQVLQKTSGTDYAVGWIGLSAGGNVSNSGTPTLDQLAIWVTATSIKGVGQLPAVNFPALTGDVTTTAASLATTIGANKVTLGMMATLAADSIIGNAAASPATPVALTSLPWAYTGDVTRPVDSNVTTLAAGNAGNLNSGTLLAARMPALTGDVTTVAGAVATTIGANKVTYAMMQDVTATSRVLGRITTGAGDPEELTAANLKTILALAFTDITGTATDAQVPDIHSQTGIPNLTSNGFVKTSGGVGTLSIDTATYEPALGNPGTSGYVLSSTTGGVRSWIAPGAGGGTPGGSTTQLQYNNAGAFGGIAGSVWDGTALTLAGSTTNSTFRVNTLEFQGYALNNCWFGDNVYFDGSGFKYRATGKAGMFYFFGDEGQFRFFVNGTGGTGCPGNATMKVNTDGSFAVGSALSQSNGAYGGSRLYLSPTTSNLRFDQNYALAWTIGDASSTVDVAIKKNSTNALEINTGTAGTFGNLIVNGLFPGGAAGTTDVCILRNSVGVIEINNGTAGTYRDLKARYINAGINTSTTTPSLRSIGYSSDGVDGGGGLEIGDGVNVRLRLFRTSDNNFKLSTDTVAAGNIVVDLKGGAGTIALNGIITGNGTVPAGGTTNQVLSKSSATDYALAWTTPAGGGSPADDTAYAASWDGVTTVPPSKNAVYDELNRRLTEVVCFTVGTGTYTPSAGTRALRVECWGGGGGGGGAKGTASSAAAGGGGGGGGYAMKYVTGTIKASYTYTVGGGGAGGAITPGAGVDGVATTFDSPSICTAVLGSGGSASGTASTTPVFQGAGGGTTLSSVCDMGMRGGNGGTGMVLAAAQAKGGSGGASGMGSGSTESGGGTGAAGSVGRQYGGGGSGASSTTATGLLGGNGADGFLRITEYF